MAKLTKAQVRNMARSYIADLLQQEQMPPSPLEEHDAELFMEEVARISARVRASITSSLNSQVPHD